MSYSPAPNEYAVSCSVFAGFPSTEVAYIRCSATLQPGVSANLGTTFLDINGNVIFGGGQATAGTYDISGLTSFNNTLKTLIGQALSGKGLITIL